MDTEFYRIKRLPPYVFEEVNRMKAQARARGEDIIDFGMGNPDNPTPPHIVAKLVEAAQNPRAHRYSSSRGVPGLRKERANFYGRPFGVTHGPDKKAIITPRSQEGPPNLPMAIAYPADPHNGSAEVR